MADLLECLIQIKALCETLEMVAPFIPATRSPESERVTVSGVWQHMAEAERRYAAALGTDGPVQPGSASTAGSAAGWIAEFAQLRGANLATLEACTADQLAGFVGWPGRPLTTVADLVAIMLANDTEVLGELRRACRHPSSAPRGLT